MNDVKIGTELLTSLIQFDLRHKNYKYTVDLADEYRDIFTGTGIAEYLKLYRANEQRDMFEQMLKIYQTVIPAVVDNLDTIFEKPLRSNKVFSTIETPNNTARDEILDRMGKFWQGQTVAGVDAYLAERWKYNVVYHPNAFIAILFNGFDPNKEKATPFAVEYMERDVYNFAYVQGVLDYLIIEQAIVYVKKRNNDGTAEYATGSKFIMYLENDAIVLTEVDKDSRITDIANPVFIEVLDKDNKNVARVFVIQIFSTLSERVPAFRVGYKLDPITNKETCISSIHYSLAFFKKELVSGVELDLTIRAHVFPQKYMYGPKCPGDTEHGKTCKKGYDNSGEVCGVCKGTGILPVHTTAQDVIIIPIPANGEEALDLNKAMAYFSPPIELVRFMAEYNDRLTQKAIAAVFPSESLVMPNQNNGTGSNPTATELDYSWDTRYDALRKFTAKYSFAWQFIIRQIAIFLDDNEGLILFHKFPSDFKMKSATTLLAEGEQADKGNFPQHVKASIHNDIANLYYADDPDTLLKIQTKNQFYPFAGKSSDEIRVILMGSDVIPYYKTLYIYFDTIFQAIDNEQGDKFYILTFDKQKLVIDKKVNDLISQQEAQKAKTFAQQLALTAANAGGPGTGA